MSGEAQRSRQWTRPTFDTTKKDFSSSVFQKLFLSEGYTLGVANWPFCGGRCQVTGNSMPHKWSIVYSLASQISKLYFCSIVYTIVKL